MSQNKLSQPHRRLPRVQTLDRLGLWLVMWLTALLCVSIQLGFLSALVALMIRAGLQGYGLWLEFLGLWGLRWHHLWDAVLVAGQIGFYSLVLRQLVSRSKPPRAWLPVLPLDQPRFHSMVITLSKIVGTQVPATLGVDASAQIRAESRGAVAMLLRRGIRMQVGLSVAVGLSTRQLAGLMAHELAYFRPLSGGTAGRIIVAVESWFRHRITHAAWDGSLWRSRDFGARWVRYFMWLIWAAARVASWPIVGLHALVKKVSTPALREQVLFADRCGAQVAGSHAYVEALEAQANLMAAWNRLANQVAFHLERHDLPELPDNLSLLIIRQLLTEPPADLEDSTHWCPAAPPDAQRMAHIASRKYPGLWMDENEEEGEESGAAFSGFHELARQATLYYYQNDMDQKLAHLRFVTVEEAVYCRRASKQNPDELRRYFGGLSHPERACCGIAEHPDKHVDSAVLKLQLMDARDFIMKHSHQTATLMKDWSRSWRMVRDLEAAYASKKAGLHVHKPQFAVFSVTELHDEIERWRGAMDCMEDQLRSYEGKMEIRISCCLELLSREPQNRLNPQLLELRRTLPHWVLIYESLGLNLPVIRELLTTFAAFQALGATVAGRVQSASYITTTQHLMPKLVAQVKNILRTLAEWPYPFRTSGDDEPLTMDLFLCPRRLEIDFLLPEEGALLLNGDRREVTQAAARKLVSIVAPFLDRYLNLYHQAYSWITKTMQIAEWHFADPLVVNEKSDDPFHSPKPINEEPYDPTFLSRWEPMEDPEETGRTHTSLLAKA